MPIRHKCVYKCHSLGAVVGAYENRNHTKDRKKKERKKVGSSDTFQVHDWK